MATRRGAAATTASDVRWAKAQAKRPGYFTTTSIETVSVVAPAPH